MANSRQLDPVPQRCVKLLHSQRDCPKEDTWVRKAIPHIFNGRLQHMSRDLAFHTLFV